MRKFILLTAISLTLTSCGKIEWFKKNYVQDNIVEEIIEEIIESKTALDIDLSPATPEEEKKESLSYLWE